MANPALRFECLPGEVFKLLTDMLLGSDLFALSHANSVLLSDLLAPTADVWRQRVPTSGCGSLTSAKQVYMTSHSFHFPGSTKGDRGCSVLLPQAMSGLCAQSVFSMSLWFALDTASSPLHQGGILLGAQSCRFEEEWRWADCHQQFIHVDPEGNLYCTVTGTKEIVARGLKTNRWYHLVFTFGESNSGKRTQAVYLGGTQIHVSTGFLHREWYSVSYWQLGSGCISGGSKGQPTQDYCGWYAFRGWVDDFTIWSRLLSATEIKELFSGATDATVTHDVLWTLKQADTREFHGDIKRVRCSRPQERIVEERA